MSFWERIRGWLSAGEQKVPDLSDVADARLRQLWKDRDELTDVASDAVRAEASRRGLRLRGLESKPMRDASVDDETATSRRPSASGNVLDVRPGLGVLVQTVPGRFALIVLPRWNASPVLLPAGLALDALIVCNHERRGWLDASAWANALGVLPDAVFATAGGPIDRAPGTEGGEATPLPPALELGALSLRRMKALPNVLRATWKGAKVSAAIGPTLPEELVEAKPASSVYVGSLPEPESKLAWSAMLAAAHGSRMMAVTSAAPHHEGPSVILVGDAVGTTLRRHTHLLPGFGISVVGTECPVAPSAIALLHDALTDRWESARRAPSAMVEEVMEHLLVERRDVAARALVAQAGEARDDATLHRLLATLHGLAGEHDEALAALRRAEDDPFSEVIAAHVHAARRAWVAAQASARRGVARAARDPDALAALARCLWLAGEVEAARTVLDEAPPFSLTGTQAADLYATLAKIPPVDPPRVAVFPHLAARALASARRAADREEALGGYRRTLELDPYCAAATEALSATEGG